MLKLNTLKLKLKSQNELKILKGSYYPKEEGTRVDIKDVVEEGVKSYGLTLAIESLLLLDLSRKK